LSQAPTHEFVATNTARWYHSHVDGASQLELGLYGRSLSSRAMEACSTTATSPMLDEKALDFTRGRAGDAQVRMRRATVAAARCSTTSSVNGKAGDAIEPPSRRGRAHSGRLSTPSLPHAVHLHGQASRSSPPTAIRPARRATGEDTVLSARRAYDLEIDGTNPGIWMFPACPITRTTA
jgi:hypothetical protein